MDSLGLLAVGGDIVVCVDKVDVGHKEFKVLPG
jgi:hypothetical protein